MRYSKGGDAHEDQLVRSGQLLLRGGVPPRGRADLELMPRDRDFPPSFSMINREMRTLLFVGAVAGFAIFLVLAAGSPFFPFPGRWAFGSFLVVAFILETLNTQLRVQALGSTSFVIHLASTLLFGPFWGGLIAALSTLADQLASDKPPIKTVFNVAQRIVAVVVAAWIYTTLGGKFPPAYLESPLSFSSDAVQRDFGLFFVFALAYFVVNSVLVSVVVALSSERTFREVWSMNTRGVLGYDVSASLIAMFVAWLYTVSERWLGFGALGLVGVVAPIVAVRHVYGLYHQLQNSGEELLQVMVKAIEARDPYTSGHSLRVRSISRAIAVELGLSAREIEQVETAALLHDVGKIHEEFAPLLRKEGRLSPEETLLMQTHSTKSAELVGIISRFRGFIQDSVRHHHERWDGLGYPTKLSGKDVPLGSRIILISDTIDAMATDRPYRKRLPLDAIVAELQRCKGTQFDPELVDVVVSSVGVRRLIAEAPAQEPSSTGSIQPRRLSWPAAVARVRGTYS
jgi:HD-GYP domain-containing protein (c-di-GMP phosphodiesterase class II)